MFSRKDYTDREQWVGTNIYDDNCTNPKKLFESVVAKSGHLVYSISYIYFDQNENGSQSSGLIRLTDDSNGIWTHTDTKKYGRCFTTRPSSKMIGYGIRKIIMGFLLENPEPVIAFFHTGGLFQTTNQLPSMKIWRGRSYDVDLEHEAHKAQCFKI